MSTLMLDQLIYTTVSEEQSPRRIRGFQVLYRSEGISAAIERAIETRLFYSRREIPEYKWVYCCPLPGLYCLARLNAVEQRDCLNRAGVHVGHALVFDEAAFALIGADPFAAFESFLFIEDHAAALAAGDATTGVLPQIPFTPEVADAWRRNRPPCPATCESLVELMALGLDLRETAGRQQTVVLQGASQRAYERLRDLFTLLPARARRQCSFDTHFDAGDIVNLPYWAIGLDRPRSSDARLPRFILDENRMYGVDAQSNPLPSGLALRWLRSEGGRRFDGAKLGAKLELIDSIECWLQDPRLPLAAIRADDPELWHEALELNRQKFVERLSAGLQVRHGRAVGSLLGRRLAANMGDLAALIAVEAEQDVEPLLEKCLAESTMRPEPALLREIRVRAPGSGSAFLNLMLMRWERRWRDLVLALQLSEDDEYERFVRWAVRTAPLTTEWELNWHSGQLRVGLSLEAPGGSDTDGQSLVLALAGTLETGEHDSGARAHADGGFFSGGRQRASIRLLPGTQSRRLAQLVAILGQVPRQRGTGHD